MTWNIVCDSSADLLSETRNDGGIRFTSVPLRLLVGERDFLDDEQLSIPQFLEYMNRIKWRRWTWGPTTI